MPLTIEQQRAIAVAQAKRKRAEAEGQGPKPQASAQPSLRSETDAIIEEAAANIPGGFAAFDAKPADPARMKAMGYVQDPLAKSGYAKPRAPEAPMADTGKTDSPFADVMRGLEAPIVGLTGGGLEGWGRTMQADSVRGASEAVDFISPVDDLGRAYQGVKQAGAGLIEGDMAKAAEGAQQASIQGSYAAMQMLPGSMTLKGVTGRAAPTTMAGAERAAVQASRAPQVMKPQAKPEPVLTPPSEAPKPFSAPPEPIGRGVVRRNLDRIIGGSVGATLGGTGDAMAAPGDGDSGGLPGGAATGAAIGIFGPRAIAAASSRGFRAAARGITPKGNRAAFDERVASRAVRKALVSGGINSEQDALNAARAKFGDKQASVSVSDLTQDGVSLTTGVSRLPGSTGELARARAEDLIENRSGRLARDVEQSTGFSTAAVSGDIDQMAKEAMEKATPEYEALRAQYPQGSLNSPRLTQIEGIGQHTKAVDDYRTATKANEGREVGDFEYWDLVKRDIDAKEQQLIDSGATMDDIRLRKLESARAALVKELDDLMPDYAAARQLGGEAPKIRGAFKEGQTYIGGRFSADEVAAKISEYTGAPLTAAQAGAIRIILGKTEGAGAAVAALRSPRAKKQLEAVFGKAKADEIQARFAADATLVQNASRTNPNVGSVTSQAGMGGGGGAVQNIAEMAQTGLRMGASPIQTALAAISKSGSYTKAQRDLMGQMLLEGVTPENVARIFAGKKPRGGVPTPTPSPAGPTTGLGGSASSTVAGGAVGGVLATGLGGVANAQEAEASNEFLAPLSQERERIKGLEAELDIILNGTVEEKQAYLAEARGLKISASGKPDGQLGPDTRAAISKARTELEAAISAGRGREKEIAGKAEGRRAEIEMKGAFDRTRPNGVTELARELGPWLGIGAGVLAGALMRKGAVAKNSAQSAARASSLNRLVSDATPTTSDIMTGRKAMGKRATNLNEFFYQGGAGKAENLKQRVGMEPKKGVPFKPDDNGDWMANPNAKDAFDLFKPGTKHFKMMDMAVIGASMAESEFAGNLAKGFHKEAEEAQKAVDKAQDDGNAANLEIAMARLESAKNAEAAAIAFQRFGQVAALARTAGAFKMPYEYTRPNVKKAQADQALILDAIRRSANIP